MSKIEEIRVAYIPRILRYVLIAESPPNDPYRFFYYPDVKQHDHLFLAVMKALYPEELKSYLLSGRITKIKVDLLKRFMFDGFYLMDLFDSASSIAKTPVDKAVSTLIESLERIASAQIPIILIKASVYDMLAKPLVKSGFANLLRERIPFPLYQWKSEFHIRFLRAIAEAGYSSGDKTGCSPP